MEYKKIKDTIYRYTPLELFSSYPVASKDQAGNTIISWFIFDIPEDDESDDERIVINKAYCMDKNYNVKAKEFIVDEVINEEVTEEPSLDYNEYMAKLVTLIENDNVDEKAIRELLAATEQFFVADLAFKAAELFTE